MKILMPFIGFALLATLSLRPLAAQTPSGTNAVSPASTNGTNAAYLGSFFDQEEGRQARERAAGTPNTFWTVVKFFLYTGVIVAAAYFIIRFVVAKGTPPSSGDTGIVEVILTRQIGMGNFLQIVKVGPAYYLLGLSGDGARLIDKIQDKETLDYIELNKDKLKPKDTKFFDFLKVLPVGKALDKMTFLKDQKDRLKKL